MDLKHSATHRGFGLIEFKDANEAECSIQESSAIGDSDEEWSRPGSSFLWVGINVPDQSRMHLSREQVQQLIPILEQWLRLGRLPSEPIQEDEPTN